MKTHKDLEVWKKSISMVTEINDVTRRFPKDELYSMVSQIRRAAISIPANISEGCARRSSREYQQFLYISLGSASELDTHLIISQNLKFCESEALLKLQESVEEIKKMLMGLIKSLNRDNN
jgi:four helix bundle protein